LPFPYEGIHMLILILRPYDRLTIGPEIVIINRRNTTVELAIDAPRELDIRLASMQPE
jgi:sRNA-binding carbon storage regulator CsrA